MDKWHIVDLDRILSETGGKARMGRTVAAVLLIDVAFLELCLRHFIQLLISNQAVVKLTKKSIIG